MTKYEREDLFHETKEGRSGRPGGITQDLTKIAPKEMGRIYRPILAKGHMATIEPLPHKGGWETSFGKPKAKTSDMTERRMILLNNVNAKHHHKFVRSRLEDVVAQLLRDAQSGARPHQSTDFVTHATLSTIQYMK